MANTKIKETSTETSSSTTSASAAKVEKESVYTVDDLIANFKAFKTSKEIVTIAMRKSGKENATFSEAKSIIEKFKNKEVK